MTTAHGFIGPSNFELDRHTNEITLERGRFVLKFPVTEQEKIAISLGEFPARVRAVAAQFAEIFSANWLDEKLEDFVDYTAIPV